MLPTKFWFIWPSGFRGEDLKKSANQKQELPVVTSLFYTLQVGTCCIHILIFFLANLSASQYELLPSLGVCSLSSVYFSHFKIF
jgi:hypothetical protein